MTPQIVPPHPKPHERYQVAGHVMLSVNKIAELERTVLAPMSSGEGQETGHKEPEPAIPVTEPPEDVPNAKKEESDRPTTTDVEKDPSFGRNKAGDQYWPKNVKEEMVGWFWGSGGGACGLLR